MLDLAFALEDTYVYFLLPPYSFYLAQLILRINSSGLNFAIGTIHWNGADNRSRLGCQVFLTKEVDGMVAKLPSATRNMYVDGESFPLTVVLFRFSSSSHGLFPNKGREEIWEFGEPRRSRDQRSSC